MNHPTGNLPNDQYINGLRDNDASVVESLYAEFRQPILRAVSALGGSDATGRAFFRIGIVEAARMARTGELPAEVPFFVQLKAIVLAHYTDWLAQREQPVPEIESPTEADAAAVRVPDSETLRSTRATIEEWKKDAQTDNAGYPLWDIFRSLEHKFAEGNQSKPKSNFARNLFIVTLLLTAGALVWFFIARSKTPAEVYDENFSLPESIISDLRMRYGPERGNDSVSSRPSACEFYIQEADAFYTAKDYESAQAVLLEILEDSLAACHSDALFYIGIIGLQQEEPELALECFSKIEDIEHFGEDIYWYQSLAFVKLAEKNPLLREKATRAVERARGNAQDSIRRAQAEKMLKHLSR